MDAAARTNADYVALGHWHSTLLLPSNGAARMAYSGTHEATRFGEANSGNALVVSIAAQGAAPEILIKKTGALRWERVGIGETITTPGKLAEVTRKLAQMPDQDKTLLEVVLSGLLFERDRDELPRIESACSRFLSVRIDKSGLRPAPNDDDWVRHLPAGAVRATAARLQQLASGNSETAEVATQALLELYTFAHEVQL
jgi:DNA repair exonuclease SbcCD nuclease subunit